MSSKIAPVIHTDERDRNIKLMFHCFWISMSVIIAVAAAMLRFPATTALICPASAQVLQEATDWMFRL